MQHRNFETMFIDILILILNIRTLALRVSYKLESFHIALADMEFDASIGAVLIFH